MPGQLLLLQLLDPLTHRLDHLMYGGRFAQSCFEDRLDGH